MTPFPNTIRSLLISIAIAAAFLIPILTSASPSFFESLERKTRDLRFQIRGPIAPSGEVIIVAIDDQSIKALGRWPWPRFVTAEVIRILASGGAKRIGVDFLFSEPEEHPEMNRIQDLIAAYQELGLLTDDARSQAFFNEMVEALESSDNDAFLASVIQDAGNVMLSFALKNLGNGALLAPLPQLAAAADRVGFVNVFPDPDGAVRKSLVFREYNGKKWWSLAACVALDIRPDLPDSFFLNYYGPHGAFPTYSLVDVLAGDIDPKIFQGKRVLIGGAAVGLGDHYPAPFASYFWGVEVHATAADNLLTGRYLQRPEWMPAVDATILFLISLTLGLVLPRLPVHFCFPFTVFIAFLFLMTGQHLFSNHRLLIIYIYPLLAAFSISIAVFWMRYATEGREKRILKAAFQQYLSGPVVERVLRHPEQLALGGEKKTLTVLFADIRNFTKMSESMSPEALVTFMNRYLTAMTDVILDNGGTLDKYVGDAVMAVFGAPEDQPDHALRACRTAREMMDVLFNKRREWITEGFPEIRIGIGVNTGPMVVGNMGSARRFDYTVMGDNVNLGCRLEGLSKIYGVKIIVSEFTREAVRKEAFAFRELDLVRVRGKEKPVRIYEMLTSGHPADDEFPFVKPFENGLAAYRSRQWDEAIRWFEYAVQMKLEDSPSTLFIERCRKFKTSSPPDGWNGVWQSSPS